VSKIKVDLFFSKQADLLLENMPTLKKENIVEWFVKERKIVIGGGDIVTYLDYLKDKSK